MPSPSRPSRTSRRRGPAGSRSNARPAQPTHRRDRSPDADADAASAEGRIAVGRINSTWGLRGHVKVTALSSNPQRFEPGAVLFVHGEPRRILEVVYPRGYPCIVFEGYEDRTAADALRGALIEIAEEELPALPEGEFYVHDLVGLTVIDPDGDALGELVEVLRTGANDVYLVRREGARDLLIPAIPEVILDVDPAAGRMRIELLPGLLEG